MTKLVLTLVGDDREGLVKAVADRVAAHGGNWEQSELTELSGAFAGIVLVSVPDGALDALVADLGALDGLLHITPHVRRGATPSGGEAFVFTVLGDDRQGIVRDITEVLSSQGLSIDRLTSRTLDAPMAGGTLFEAVLSVRAPHGTDLQAAVSQLERLADEIQVDLTLV
ncbi:MAG: ACT domain-containing protein [Microbacterium sp.]